MIRRRVAAVAVAVVLVGWAVLLAVLLSAERGESHAVGYAFAGVVGLAGVAFGVTLLRGSRAVQAMGACASGSAVTVVGVLAGASIGLPLIPVGVAMVIFAMTAAEATPRPLRTFALCAAASVAAAPVYVLMVFGARLIAA
ncbi:MAG: hypothetical protein M3295_04010 [Chloroflexota bacterium]|nr:hypothetical protein [Chloroflexota bacterium]